MKHHLDWSSYETAGQGDAYAGIPATGGDFARAVAVCIGDRLCQRTPKGVMCPSFRVSGEIAQTPLLTPFELVSLMFGSGDFATVGPPGTPRK